MSRTFRKSYTGAKAVCGSCRNHGTCAYCSEGRIYKHKRRLPADLKEQENSKLNQPS